MDSLDPVSSGPISPMPISARLPTTLEKGFQTLTKIPQLNLLKEELEQVRREKDEWRKESQAKSVSEDNEQKILMLQEKLQILRMRHQDE